MTDTSTHIPSTTDVRDLFDRAVELTTGVIAAVRPEQMNLSTPCPEIDVREMLVHLNEVLDRLTRLGRGESPFPIARREALTDAAVLDTWHTAAAETRAAWVDDAVLDTPMLLPWAQCPGREMMQGYIAELTTHTWDLATAIGAQPAWDDEVIAAALVTARAWLPADRRPELFAAVAERMGSDAGPAPYAAAVPVSDTAALIDQLVAHQGRNPAWTR